ncbi:TPA: LuxR C-terminal-related transcriptional regulator [Klebsiella aerogenes]
MIRVVISLSDAYLRLALVSLVCREVVTQRLRATKTAGHTPAPDGLPVRFDYGLDEAAVRAADLIITDLTPAGPLLCDPRLAGRRPGCRVMMVGEQLQTVFPLLPCLRLVALVDTRAPLRFVTGVIRSVLKNRMPALSPAMCRRCRAQRLSPGRQRVADCLFRGMGSQDIARQLSLRIKTVYAHKRAIMVRFGLTNDYELCAYLRLQQKKERHWQHPCRRTDNE